jgi:hypothetical protein
MTIIEVDSSYGQGSYPFEWNSNMSYIDVLNSAGRAGFTLCSYTIDPKNTTRTTITIMCRGT